MEEAAAKGHKVVDEAKQYGPSLGCASSRRLATIVAFHTVPESCPPTPPVPTVPVPAVPIALTVPPPPVPAPMPVPMVPVRKVQVLPVPVRFAASLKTDFAAHSGRCFD